MEGESTTLIFSGLDASSVDAASLRFSFARNASELASEYAAAASTATSNPIHFPDSGSFLLFGRVFDKDGGVFDTQTVVVVGNVNPTGMLTSNSPVSEPGEVTLSFTASDISPADAGNLRYSFAASEDELAGSFAEANASSSASLQFGRGGNYQVFGRTFDQDGGSLTLSATVTVLNVAPTLAIATTDVFQGVVGQPRAMLLTATDFGGPDELFTYAVNWGDGQTEQMVGGVNHSISHAYLAIGNYAVTVTATDASGDTSEVASRTVQIVNTEVQAGRLAISGAAGNDSFVLTPTSTSLAQFTITRNGTSLGNFAVPAAGFALFGGVGVNSVTVNGSAAKDTFTIESNKIKLGTAVVQGADIQNWLANGLGEADRFVLLSGAAQLDGGTQGTTGDSLQGPDSSQTWLLSGAEAGSVGGSTFLGIENLSGGTSNDVFRLTYSTAKISGKLDGGGGVDQLDYSILTTPVNINLKTNSATNITSLASIEAFTGSVAQIDTLTAADTANAWSLTGDNRASLNGSIVLQDIENMTGGSNADFITVMDGGELTGTFNAGSGVDTLSYANSTGPVVVNLATRKASRFSSLLAVESFHGSTASNDQLIAGNGTNSWSITGPNAGTVTGSSFASFEDLQGGVGSDSIKLNPGASLTGDQFLDALGFAKVRRQDLRGEVLPLSSRPAIKHPRLLDSDLAQPGDDLPLRHEAIANHLVAATGHEPRTHFKPLGNFFLNGLSEQFLGSLAEDARENILGRDWQADRGCVNFLHGGVLLEKKGVW